MELCYKVTEYRIQSFTSRFELCEPNAPNQAKGKQLSSAVWVDEFVLQPCSWETGFCRFEEKDEDEIRADEERLSYDYQPGEQCRSERRFPHTVELRLIVTQFPDKILLELRVVQSIDTVFRVTLTSQGRFEGSTMVDYAEEVYGEKVKAVSTSNMFFEFIAGFPDFFCPEIQDFLLALPVFGERACNGGPKVIFTTDMTLKSVLIHMFMKSRFRGYPADFYTLAAWHYGQLEKTDFSMLPEEYEELEGSKGLLTGGIIPDVRSMRRWAFRNPWLVPITKQINKIPFDNIDILHKLLDKEWAIPWLLDYAANKSGKHPLLVDVLIERFGEVGAWRLIDKVDRDRSDEPNVFLRKCPVSLFDTIFKDSCYTVSRYEKCLSVVWLLRQDRRVVQDYVCCSKFGFIYPEETEALEQIGSVSFVLPRKPFEYLWAGTKLRNCLATYLQDLHWHSPEVLFIKRGESLIGACEVCMRSREVEQAFGPQNEPLSGEVLSSFLEWVSVKGLKLSEDMADLYVSIEEL